MFWNYVYSQGLFFPSAFQIVGFSASQNQEQPSSPSISKGSNIQESENKKKILNISEEDLKQTSYETSKMVWTEEEDLLLKKLRDEEHLDWNKIASMMPERNSKMCYSRYRRLENASKQIWRKADDDLLLTLIKEKGEDWKEISKYFERRTHKQIKEHFNNYLREGIKRQEWTIEEDMKLVDLLNQYGRQWKLIEQLFEGRTQNQIKNRYFGRLKRISDKNAILRERARLSQKKKPIFPESL